ncbi:2-hydroxymuconate tautomerase [Lapidilactobacillus bayanensis]|uniref:2-hydroxymuconate tautomerase n=1 Tax=Lapidilactobacillus bayanensis TaxID=2485998 RepID=UPI000F787220|nr:2-hydroxymuconate tautomerase [Lapidilactobacillus bayanensis]
MPFVHIEVVAGRSEAQLKAMIEDVTAAVVKNINVPAEHVHVILDEMQPNRYAQGGVLRSEQK